MNLTDFIPGADIVKVGMGIIDKLIPDPEAKARAQAELLKAEREGQLEDVKMQLSAIMAEAQSSDPWTSRARPSFLYVMYILILVSIPMGFVAAFKPELATAIAAGMGAWLDAIPDSLWTLFGVGYLGYTGARMWEKNKGSTK